VVLISLQPELRNDRFDKDFQNVTMIVQSSSWPFLVPVHLRADAPTISPALFYANNPFDLSPLRSPSLPTSFPRLVPDSSQSSGTQTPTGQMSDILLHPRHLLHMPFGSPLIDECPPIAIPSLSVAHVGNVPTSPPTFLSSVVTVANADSQFSASHR
jgi:hypothetical protein